MKTEWLTRRITIDLFIETNVERDGTIITVVINTAASNAKHTEIGTLTRSGNDWRIANGNDETILYASTKAEAIRSFEKRAAQQAAKWAIA